MSVSLLFYLSMLFTVSLEDLTITLMMMLISQISLFGEEEGTLVFLDQEREGSKKIICLCDSVHLHLYSIYIQSISIHRLL